VACFQLGRQPEFDNVEKKLSLLGRALEFCPPDKLHDVLVAWRRLEKEDIENRRERLSDRHNVTRDASSTKKPATSSMDSLANRLQEFRVSTTPLLNTPDAAALASRTLRTVAANFPFGRRSIQEQDTRAKTSEGRRRSDSGDVSAQATRVLSKGLGWLIGDDV
jgi:neuroblastoma-amplified sequence